MIKIPIFLMSILIYACSNESYDVKELEIYSYKWELRPDSSRYDLACKIFTIIDKNRNYQMINFNNSRLINSPTFKYGAIDKSEFNTLLKSLIQLKGDTELIKNYVSGGTNPYLLIKLHRLNNDSIIAFTMADSSLSSNLSIVNFYNYLNLKTLDKNEQFIHSNFIMLKKNTMDSLVLNHEFRFIPPPPPIPIKYLLRHKEILTN